MSVLRSAARALLLLGVALSAPAAWATPAAPPDPWWQGTGILAFGGWPAALYAEVDVERRWALHRSRSPVFRNTFVGVGGMLAGAPPFVRIGPRFSVSPLDVFVLDVQPSACLYFPDNGSGLLPYSEVAGKLDTQRTVRRDTADTGLVGSLLVSPTFQIQLGPVIALANPAFDFVHVQGATAPFLYDAMHDLLIRPDDVELQAWYLALVDFHPGQATIRAGGAVRHAEAFGSGDTSIAAGPTLMVKPGAAPSWPLVVAQVLPYLVDTDRVGRIPLVFVVVQWDSPLSAD